MLRVYANPIFPLVYVLSFLSTLVRPHSTIPVVLCEHQLHRWYNKRQ